VSAFPLLSLLRKLKPVQGTEIGGAALWIDTFYFRVVFCVFAGVLAKTRGRTWFFDGEFVVD
jgi:hypothetical protein